MNNGRDCPHGRQVGKCDTCDLIEAEKDVEALKAQVAMLRVACQLGIDMFKANDINVPNTIETLQEAIDATPAQCLGEIKARAGRDGFIAGVGYAHKRPDVVLPKVIEMVAHDYANRLHQQAKKGER